MLKKLICIITLISMLVSGTALLSGCSKDTEDNGTEGTVETEGVKLKSPTKGQVYNDVYVINSKDFNEFKKAATGGSSKRSSYNVPVVEQLNTEDSYYVIGHTAAQSGDGKDITLKNGFFNVHGTDFEDGYTISERFGELERLETGTFSADSTTVKVTQDKFNDHGYNVEAEIYSSKADFFVYLKVKVTEEMRLNVSYSTIRDTSYTEYNKETTGTAELNVYLYFEHIILSNFKASYLAAEDYVNGVYSTSSLKDSMEMKVGEDYYVVVYATVTTLSHASKGKTLTLKAKIPNKNVIDGTLDTAASGSYAETIDRAVKTMEIDFRIPDPSAGDKKYEFIFKVTPLAATEDTTFHIEMISKDNTTITCQSNLLDLPLTVVN